MKRKALGKGLRSLIPHAPSRAPRREPPPESGSDRGLQQIDLDLIRPNRQQPRQRIDDETLAGLAQSLENQGVLQPVVVRPSDNGRYELVAGERRWRAAQMVGLLKIPAIVRDVPDDRLLEYALVENLQREELNPIEEAQAYRTLADEYGLSQQEIADRAGRQRTTVSNMVRLLALPEAVQDKLRNRELSTGHAKALLGLEQAIEQIRLADRIARDELSVRETERIVARLSRSAPRKKRARAERDPNVVAAEESLQRALGTKVRIHPAKSGGGRIEVHCFDNDSLDRVYEQMIDAARDRKSRS